MPHDCLDALARIQDGNHTPRGVVTASVVALTSRMVGAETAEALTQRDSQSLLSSLAGLIISSYVIDSCDIR
jgi:hypothetical protein